MKLPLLAHPNSARTYLSGADGSNGANAAAGQLMRRAGLDSLALHPLADVRDERAVEASAALPEWCSITPPRSHRFAGQPKISRIMKPGLDVASHPADAPFGDPQKAEYVPVPSLR